MRLIQSAADVDQAILDDVEDVLDGWFSEGRIDWEDFIDRLSDTYGPQASPPYEILDLASPAVRKIQRFVRELRS